MHYSSTLPRRPRQVKVPAAPTAAQISKKLKPILFDDRSSGRRKKKVQFTGWHRRRAMLVDKRARCLRHIATLSLLLVLVTATTLGFFALPDLIADDVGSIEDAYVGYNYNLLEIFEEFGPQPLSTQTMFLGSVPDEIVEIGPQIITTFYDLVPVSEPVEEDVEDMLFDYDEFTSIVHSDLMFWDYPTEEEVVVEEYEPYVPYVPYVPALPLTPVTGNHDEIVWNFFISRGFSPQVTAGIIGNLQQESGVAINPNTIGDVHLATTSRGIAQWREGRLTNLHNFANARGLPWNDLTLQLDFMYHEMNCETMQRRFRGDNTSWNNYMPALTRKNATPVDGIDGLRRETCIENAVRVMDAAFHRSGVPNFPRRIQFAEDAFVRFYQQEVSYSNYDEDGGPWSLASNPLVYIGS